jgi:bifunctional non-homologous end joining protein LigD
LAAISATFVETQKGQSKESDDAGKSLAGTGGDPQKMAVKQGRPKKLSYEKPAFIEPMKARLVDKPPAGEWIYEIKLDGFRALAVRDGLRVRLFSRNGNDLGQKFPSIVAGLAKLRAEDAIIDGEIVALNEHGVSAFQLLQAYDLGEERPPIVFYVFDLLRLNGEDLRSKPISERKSELEKLVKAAPENIRFSASLEGDVDTLLEGARKVGLEGLIGKRKGSTYEAGKRSGAWIKLKINNEQEFVIGGYTEPKGGRAYFGSLLVGHFKGQKFLFAGKVGTGFTDASLKAVYRKMAENAAEECPFANLPEPRGSRFSPGLTAAEMRRCRWVKPKLVCQIKFTEWTRDAKLRHPVFLGLREDKAAFEVRREKA